VGRSTTTGAHESLLDDGRSGDGTAVVGRLVSELDGFEASVVAL
jgi:hypothetical protein